MTARNYATKRNRAVSYLQSLPAFKGIGRETLVRFVSVVAIFYGVSGESNSTQFGAGKHV